MLFPAHSKLNGKSRSNCRPYAVHNFNGKAGAVFDIIKLRWLNTEYLKRESDDELHENACRSLPKDFVQQYGERKLKFALGVLRAGATTHAEAAQRVVALVQSLKDGLSLQD